MTHVFHHQIDTIIKSNKMYRFEAELNDTENEERKELLKRLVDESNAQKNKKQISEETIKKHIQMLKDSQYQKKWQFLNAIQKESRINEYLTSIGLIDENIKQRLLRYLKMGVLKTKHIEYDVMKGSIENITILKSAGDGVFTLDSLINEKEVRGDSDVETVVKKRVVKTTKKDIAK